MFGSIEGPLTPIEYIHSSITLHFITQSSHLLLQVIVQWPIPCSKMDMATKGCAPIGLDLLKYLRTAVDGSTLAQDLKGINVNCRWATSSSA